MADGFTIVIAADGDELHRSFLRETYGADGLAQTIATHVARFRDELFAAASITVTITRESNPAFAELQPAGSYGGGYDDDIL